MPVFLGFSLLLALVLRTRAPLASAPIARGLHQICVSSCPRSIHAEYLRAIVCGEAISSFDSNADFKSAFAQTGLIHLLVVSGSHLICLEIVVRFLAAQIFNARFFSAQKLYSLSSSVIIFFLLAIFVLMTGASPPALRSFIQWVLSRVSERFKWNWSRAQLVCVSGFSAAAFCQDRWSLCSLFLSWIAALALGFPTRARDESVDRFKKFVASLRHALLVNSSVYFAVIPALLPLGVPSMLSIICNLVFAPAMGLVLFPLSGLAFLWHRVSVLADAAWGLCLVLVGGVAARLPIAWDRIELSHYYLVPYVGLLSIWLLFFRPQKRRTQLASLSIASCVLILSSAADARDELIVWNVGQGSWATLSSPTLCQHFDMGGEHAPFAQIRFECATKQNEVLYSHWDWDHISFTKDGRRVLNNLCVESAPGGETPSRGKAALISSLPVCDVKMVATEVTMRENRTLVRGRNGKRPNANDASKVYVEDNVIFPGDSPSGEEKSWSRSSVLARARILIAGHHGSKTATSAALLSKLRRLKMIIVSARHERYGHPHREMLQRARSALVPVLKTEDWGSLHIELSP